MVTAAVSAANEAAVTPTSAGEPLSFAAVNTNRGSTILHDTGTAEFTVQQTGTYEISYSATASAAAGTGSASPSLTLQVNGTPIPGSGSSASLSDANPTASLSNSVIADITAPGVITLNAGGADASFSSISLSVKHLTGL